MDAGGIEVGKEKREDGEMEGGERNRACVAVSVVRSSKAI